MMKCALLVALSVLLAACVTSAPDLPVDRTAVNGTQRPTLAELTPAEVAMTCDQVRDERARYVAAIQQANTNVESNRVRNQTATYLAAVSVLALPALLATEGNYADKDAVRAGYAKIDRLNVISLAKSCGSPPS